ncbi:MAG: hypothetical protein JW807_16480 [Spirochaetes bacterium]|nr:hypothetical protein [Spirochaetota bacterium]
METLHDNKFNEAIEARLRSGEWDRSIAGRVLRRRRRKLYMRGAVGSAASMALAASLIFGIIPAFRGGTVEGEAMNRFVNAQVEGVWGRTAQVSGVQESNDVLIVDARYDTSTDIMIEQALEGRF